MDDPDLDICASDTWPLLIASWIAAGSRLIGGALSGRNLNALIKVIGQINSLTREMCEVEQVKFNLSLKDAMLGDAEWKRRVWLELGGYWVIKRWSARYAAALELRNANIIDQLIFEILNEAFGAPKAAARPNSAVGASSVKKTDSSGRFCLAPILRTSNASQTSAGQSGVQPYALSFRPQAPRGLFTLIALTPDEIEDRKALPLPKKTLPRVITRRVFTLADIVIVIDAAKRGWDPPFTSLQFRKYKAPPQLSLRRRLVLRGLKPRTDREARV